MKKFLPLVLLVSGCAIRDYQITEQLPNGVTRTTKIRSHTLFQMSSAQAITVSSNALKVTKFAGEVDKEAIGAVAEGVAAGMVKGMK